MSGFNKFQFHIPRVQCHKTKNDNDVYQKGLNIMDMTAFTLCQENNKSIIVFDMNIHGNLKKVVQGNKIGTLVK